MSTDLTVFLENRPGTLAELGEILGREGVNIDGICGIPEGSQGVIHILVEDAPAARQALTKAGMEVREERPVLVKEVMDRPGEMGKLTRRIADAGVNIDLIYTAMNGRVVLGVSDIDKVRGML